MPEYYDEKTLLKLHKKEVEILKYFMDLCKKNDLKFFPVFGTLLGAVRHNGFIPWDDDIDVGMLREDYERFLDIADKQNNDKFFVQSDRNEAAWHLPFAKVRMNGTKFVEHGMEGNTGHCGIYIDVFPFDNIPDDDRTARKQILKAEMLQRLHVAKMIKDPQVGYSKGAGLRKVMWHLLRAGMAILRISENTLWDKYQIEVLKYRYADTSRTTSIVSEGFKDIIYKSEIEPLTEGRFEDVELLLPNGYDAILTRCYGDYMQLPPEDRRVNHYPSQLDFGD